ncbi:PAS domain S-box protein [Paenibacillus sp. PR3]|uniref:Sensor histidine kinase n=1 Tax=Paenibacillus terricola TaxID=2763503 RepID=A0ABR8MUT8_9BACL|nr:PAS domain-containing sensor histidine kinase [Paenibacillus terricola]MBD3919736.1 PAS domain S-box protein [Paenibacillus terricola]
MKQDLLDKIFLSIQDGIIIMDQHREVVEMNPAATRLTGWRIKDKVPYCSYCQNRQVAEGEERCYLISRETVPYFLSEMPTYHGDLIDVEMSTALILEEENGRKYYLLMLKDWTVKRKEEEARVSKSMLKQLIEAKELEHKRLAQELHDGVGQSLYSIAIAMDTIMQRIHDAPLHAYIDEVRKELGKTMDDVKSYAQQLRPRSLDSMGLVPTIEQLVQSVQNKMPDTRFSFGSNLEGRLPAMVEINMYRAVQEALHNIMKYSNASHVSIQIQKEEPFIHIHITDNGVGFHLKDNKEGMGLRHIVERMSQIGGTTEIHSQIGEGTSIDIAVPTNQEWEHEDDNSDR